MEDAGEAALARRRWRGSAGEAALANRRWRTGSRHENRRGMTWPAPGTLPVSMRPQACRGSASCRSRAWRLCKYSPYGG